MSETETKTITGACEEVSEKNGWTSFAVDVGTQYPIRLSTKLDPIIELGRAASRNGGAFDWTYTESQGAENPHKPGTFYMNRYLSGVEPAGSVPASGQAATQTPVKSDTLTKDEWARKDSAANHRACIAIAVGALTHTMAADPGPEDLRKFIERTKTLSHEWHRQVEATRAGDDSDVPFLSAHDEEIPY